MLIVIDRHLVFLMSYTYTCIFNKDLQRPIGTTLELVLSN